ncbi:MAG: hypothetical protein KDC38_15440 [Planctomycetes bacterium]|nr:hypothetical protein [Planctomycetota bacterium]
MTRPLALIASVVVLGLAVWWLWPRDDEAEIRSILAGLEAAFDDASARRLIADFDETWRDLPTGTGRELLRSAATAFFLRERHPKTRAFDFDLEIDERAALVEVRPDRTASVTVEVEVRRLRDSDEPRTEWRFELRAMLDERDGRWRITETDWTTIEGRRPSFSP